MTYFDTDVLVNALVSQDQQKHKHSRELLDYAVSKNSAVISILSIQEVLFVLGRLGSSFEQAQAAFEELVTMQPVSCGVVDLRRAVEISRRVGLRNINDCIHTAIAESHCSELITYNRQDFIRIRDLTSLKVTII